MKRYYIDLDDSLRRSANHLEGERERVSIAQMPGKRGADDDDYVPPSGAARGAKKHPVSEAVLRFATEKKGAKAGPFVNKIFESSLEGAEQKVQQLEEADAASAEGAQPLSIIADCLMMIVAWLFYFIKIEWLDEREESSGMIISKSLFLTTTSSHVIIPLFFHADSLPSVSCLSRSSAPSGNSHSGRPLRGESFASSAICSKFSAEWGRI